MKKEELRFSGCMYCYSGMLRFIWMNYNDLRKHIEMKHKNRLDEFDKEVENYLKQKSKGAGK